MRYRALLPLVLIVAFVEQATAAETLAALLESRVLVRNANPVPINYLLNEGKGRLPAAVEEDARSQLVSALRVQTSPMVALMSGINAGMNAPAMQNMRERAGEAAKPTSIVKSIASGMLGLGGIGGPAPPTQQEAERAQEEMKQGMADPWIRGIEAAEAYVALGDAQSAGRFYTTCLGMASLGFDWIGDACLGAIVRLGPRRGFALLDWMLKNPEQALPGTGMAGVDGLAESRADAITRIRSRALEGLGRLIGAGGLDAASRESAFAALLAHADGKANAPVFAGVAAGLGYARDPRGLEPLRRLWKKAGRNAELREAAARGLVVGFRDASATAQMRKLLDDDDRERRFRAAALLFQIGDAEAFEWAVGVVTDRRAQEDNSPDIRARVTRDLLEQGGEQGRAALADIHRRGAGNDWLQAWVATALLEGGDTSKLAEVRQALAKADWSLDRPGIRAWWGRISPFIQLAAQFALTGTIDTQTALQVVGQLVASERNRFAQASSLEEMLVAQLRWQAADAFATSGGDETIDDLRTLLADERAVVRISAARAFALHPSPRAIEGYEAAMNTDFGAEAGVARAPEVRSALLRAAVMRHADDTRTEALCRLAANDPDPGVRFIGLAELHARGASAS